MNDKLFIQQDKNDDEMFLVYVQHEYNFAGEDKTQLWLACILHYDTLSCFLSAWQMEALKEFSSVDKLSVEVNISFPDIDDETEYALREASDDWDAVLMMGDEDE